MGFGRTRLPAGWDALVTWSHHGDPGPACHPQHLPGTLQGNESISFGLNPFSPLSSMEEWKRGKQMGKNTPPQGCLCINFFIFLLFKLKGNSSTKEGKTYVRTYIF